MRIRNIALSAALAVAVIGTSLAGPFAASPARASTGPYSLEMDPLDYYAYLANPLAVHVPYQPVFGQW